MVALTPVLLPVAVFAAAVSVWRIERNLARMPCAKCGQAFGTEEIRRAKSEALSQAWAGYDPASGLRRRIAPIWQVACQGCGASYTYAVAEPNAALVLR
jgi:hypothetical protein